MKLHGIGKIYLLVAAAVIAFGIIFWCIPALGFNNGADFAKSYSVEIQYRNQEDYNQIVSRAQKVLNDVKDSEGKAYPDIKIIKHEKLGDAQTGLTLKIYYKGIGSEMDAVNADIVDALKADLVQSSDPYAMQVTDAAEVNPIGATERLLQAVAAAIIAVVVAMIYLMFRFNRESSFAALSVAAIDTLLLLALTSILRLQVNFPFIAVSAALICLSFVYSAILFNRIKQNGKSNEALKANVKELTQVSLKQSFWTIALTSAFVLMVGLAFTVAGLIGGLTYLEVALPLMIGAAILFLDWLFALPVIYSWFSWLFKLRISPKPKKSKAK